MLFALSKVIPVLMFSTYTVEQERRRERCRWVQWRGRVFFPRRSAV